MTSPTLPSSAPVEPLTCPNAMSAMSAALRKVGLLTSANPQMP